jgi:hypothetical protein
MVANELVSEIPPQRAPCDRLACFVVCWIAPAGIKNPTILLARHFQSSHNPNKFKLEAILEAQR